MMHLSVFINQFKYKSLTTWHIRCKLGRKRIISIERVKYPKQTLLHCQIYLNVILGHQSSFPPGVLSFNPAASNILKHENTSMNFLKHAGRELGKAGTEESLYNYI